MTVNDARYTTEDLERVAGAAVRAALAQVAAQQAPPAPAPSPAPALPEWMSTADYAERVGKAPKTIREYARRAPAELAIKYGRDWRLAGPAFDAWVRRGGPFRQHDEEKTEIH